MADEIDDLKNGAGAPPADDQAGNDGEEMITIKKSDLAKLESDRDNYKAATLKKKADERSLDKDGVTPPSNDGSNTDVAKLVQEQVSVFQSDIYKSNERRAQARLLQLHPEYADDASYTDLLSDFTSKRGKATSEDILEDMEDAVLLHKRRTGKLDEYLKSERERGRQEGQIFSQMNSGRNVGGTGDRNSATTDSSPLSPKGEEIARGMHVDPTKAAKIDPRKDNTISLIK